MRTFLSRRRGQVVVAVVAVVLVVMGGLWWTKTIAFTRAQVVAYNSDPMVPTDAENTSNSFSAAPFDAREIWSVADRIAETYGGTGADYQDLSISFAPEPPATIVLVVTARGRTPSSAQRLANYGAEALSAMINESTFAYTGRENATYVRATQ